MLRKIWTHSFFSISILVLLVVGSFVCLAYQPRTQKRRRSKRREPPQYGHDIVRPNFARASVTHPTPQLQRHNKHDEDIG